MKETTLAQMKRGQSAVIKGYADDNIPSKFYEMGLLPGNQINFVRTSLFRDPIMVNVSGSQIAIRKDDAKRIVVEMMTK